MYIDICSDSISRCISIKCSFRVVNKQYQLLLKCQRFRYTCVVMFLSVSLTYEHAKQRLTAHPQPGGTESQKHQLHCLLLRFLTLLLSAIVSVSPNEPQQIGLEPTGFILDTN